MATTADVPWCIHCRDFQIVHLEGEAKRAACIKQNACNEIKEGSNMQSSLLLKK